MFMVLKEHGEIVKHVGMAGNFQPLSQLNLGGLTFVFAIEPDYRKYGAELPAS